jgi:hypothetical protein
MKKNLKIHVASQVSSLNLPLQMAYNTNLLST